MPELQDDFKELNDARRELLESKLPDNVVGNIAKPIRLRNRLSGESWDEYREAQYLYYQGLLEDRWSDYLSGIEKEIVKQYDYGGVYGVVNLMNQGYFEMPGEIIRYDMYDIQSNSAMVQLLEVGIPVDETARQMVSYLESTAWRTAAETSGQLKGLIDLDVRQIVNESMVRVIEDPEFGRKEFVELLSSPLNGNPPPMSAARARMIARTETTRAQAEASKELAKAMRAQGYQIVEIWRTFNPCEICEPLEGTTRETGNWPSDPPVHPNCDCTIDIELLNG